MNVRINPTTIQRQPRDPYTNGGEITTICYPWTKPYIITLNSTSIYNTSEGLYCNNAKEIKELLLSNPYKENYTRENILPNKQFQYQIERIPKITITTASTTTVQSTTNVTKRYNATVFNTTTKPIIKTNATTVTKKYTSCYQIEIKKECTATNPYTYPLEQNWNKCKEYNYCVETYICQGKGNCCPANTLLNEARNICTWQQPPSKDISFQNKTCQQQVNLGFCQTYIRINIKGRLIAK